MIPKNPVKQGRVIGVVQDFHYKSLHEKVSPSVIQLYPQVLYKVAVKLQPTDINSTIGFIEDQWNKFAPEYPFDYQFMDESYGQMYKNEEKLSSLLWIFRCNGYCGRLPWTFRSGSIERRGAN
jgi:putative ABC transport system permease protein